MCSVERIEAKEKEVDSRQKINLELLMPAKITAQNKILLKFFECIF